MGIPLSEWVINQQHLIPVRFLPQPLREDMAKCFPDTSDEVRGPSAMLKGWQWPSLPWMEAPLVTNGTARKRSRGSGGNVKWLLWDVREGRPDVKSTVSKSSSSSVTAHCDRVWSDRNTISTCLTLPMLRLLSSNAQECKKLWKSSWPRHLGIHMKVLVEIYQMSTHLPWFQSF